ncbi:hypothetical protein [Anaeromusa sp.]|uniref:hypothetical protein n=1 Tax=Anaeromusa sp. TaxID=1872520 RepID=UPI0026097AB8|nr:hypothetical protein [Anaeromusa sp.]MDD3157770.1 hypothetical protein [Anaeromusa sp.]
MKQSILVSVDNETNRILQEVQNGIFEGTRDAIEQVRMDIIGSFEENQLEVKTVADKLARAVSTCNNEIKGMASHVSQLPTSEAVAKISDMINGHIETVARETRKEVKAKTEEIHGNFIAKMEVQNRCLVESQQRYMVSVEVQQAQQQQLLEELVHIKENVKELQAELAYLRQPWYKKLF